MGTNQGHINLVRFMFVPITFFISWEITYNVPPHSIRRQHVNENPIVVGITRRRVEEDGNGHGQLGAMA